MTNRIKDIRIESNSWEKIKILTRINRIERKSSYRKVGDLISSLLVMHKEGRISIKPFKLENVKSRKIDLTEEAWDYYMREELIGDRTHLINGLLRIWLEENN